MCSKRLLACAAALLALVGMASSLPSASAETTPSGTAAQADTKSTTAAKPAGDDKAAGKKTFTKAEIEAFLTKCSVEADEKGLTKAKNKLAERKAFRRQCMSKFGVEPK